MESTKHFFLHFTLGAKNFAQQKQKSIPETTFQYLIYS